MYKYSTFAPALETSHASKEKKKGIIRNIHFEGGLL